MTVYNKVSINGEAVIDLSGDTVTADTLALGVTAHNAKGELITGTMPSYERSDIVNMIYPVGSVYMSLSDTEPAAIFGGTWEKIQERFLLASGESYAAGGTGGAIGHSHMYGVSLAGYYGALVGEKSAYIGVLKDGTGDCAGMSSENWKTAEELANSSTTTTSITVSPHHYKSTANTSTSDTLPPYLAVNVWKRTA